MRAPLLRRAFLAPYHRRAAHIQMWKLFAVSANNDEPDGVGGQGRELLWPANILPQHILPSREAIKSNEKIELQRTHGPRLIHPLWDLFFHLMNIPFVRVERTYFSKVILMHYCYDE